MNYNGTLHVYIRLWYIIYADLLFVLIWYLTLIHLRVTLSDYIWIWYIIYANIYIIALDICVLLYWYVTLWFAITYNVIICLLVM